ncbi:MAG: ribonuclease Y [Candidatus Paceibacterota bacterium]
MPLELVAVLLTVTGIIGLGLGYFLRWLLTLGKRGTLEMDIKERMLEAEEEAKRLTFEAEQRAEKILEEARKDIREREEELKKTERRLIKKEELLDQRQIDIDSEVDYIKERVGEIKELRGEAENLVERRRGELEKATGLSTEDARDELLKQIEAEYEEDLAIRIQKLDRDAEERFERKAREVLTTAVHRLGNNLESDILSSTISLPSEDVKGKIIGREGRNIKAFERATGVEVVIDDTPEVVVLSSFDPVRRAIAKLALERLITDGRIQPARIEEFVENAQNEINKVIKEKGEEAAYECGILSLDDRVISILGRLHFRTSYGQNVLAHSIEVSHLAGMIAEEIGADVSVAKAAGLLHDIGKAVDHELPGTHVAIGIRILQKFGVDKSIIDAMKSHHEEHPYETLESYIVQVADSISASRPGARRDSLENYLKRLAELEAIANKVNGVEKSYAISAGREVRVFVNPEEISDYEAHRLARKIAEQIEKELRYPGEIKIHVIRENRVVAFAR